MTGASLRPLPGMRSRSSRSLTRGRLRDCAGLTRRGFRRGSVLRGRFGRNGQVAEGRAVRLIGEILTPLVAGEVAIGDAAGVTHPGFEIHVPQHHAADATEG